MKKLSLLFAALLAVSTMFADVLSWNASAQGYENAQGIDTVTFGNPVITMTFNKGTNNNAPKYYTTGAAVRCYGGNYFTVDAGANTMTAIDLTFASGEGTNAITTNAGEYADGAWTGSATNVTFTIGGTSGHRRIATISVTLAAGSDTTVVPVEMETLLFNANIWNVTDVNEKYAAWIWGDSLEGQWTDFFTPLNAQNMYAVQIPVTADSIVFVRLNNTIDTVKWTNIWNQTIDYAINYADLYFTVEGWGEGENAKSYGTWGTPVVYNTCADVNAVTANTNMTLGEVTVVFIKGSNIYVKDETGTTLVYTNNYSDLIPGDRVSGIAGQAKLYNGLPELAPTTAFADLTVVPGEAPVIFDAQAAPTVANVNQVMMFRGVQMPAASFTTSRASNITGIFAGEEVAFRNNWKEAYDFDSTKTYSMLGCVAIYNGAIQVYVTNIEEEVAPVQNYYIKNNWNGASDWTWVAMNPVMNNVIYEYTGVFGGTGVNINTTTADAGSTWFSVENFSVLDSTFVPQALDTLHFLYSIVDSVLAVELVGRPAADTLHHYYIKNNWNGAADWSWVEMTPVEGQENIYEYTGVFGGTGVNITSNYMNGELWFPVDSFLVNEGDLVPQAMDTVLFAYNSVENEVGAMVLGRPEPVVLDTIVAGVHIINETGWAQLNLYMWGEAGELFGGWPGQTLNEDYAVEGVEGSYFAIIGPYAGLEENLIFNDGNDVQFRDLTISLVDTVYEIVVRADGAYFADQVPAEALTIAEATATEVGTELITRGIVTYINNKNAYIQDATAGILLYGTAAFADQFSVGDEIIVSAKRAEYGGAPELSYVTLDTILSFGNTVTPIRMTLAERAAEPFKNFGMMVTVKDLTISAFDNYNNPTLTDGENSAVCYKMNVDTTVFHIGDIVDITAIAGYFNAIQFQGDVAGITMHVDDMYYIKNNWNRGADWTWMDMIPADDGNLTWMYTGIFGGTGVNINTAATDENALWFPIDAMIIPEGNEAPEAGDSVMFVYNTVDKTVTATVLSQDIPGEDITVTFFVRDENTIWEDLYVYAWGAAEAFGAWNGYQVNQEENMIVGGEYDYRFTLTGDYEGLTLNLIFNDGIGGGEGHQFADLAIEDMQDGDEYFIIVTDEKAYFEGGDGLEEVVSNAKNETTKVIMNGQLYIIRDGKVYNALGAQVR